MQPTSILAILVLAAIGAMANPPPKPQPPPPPPPTISQTISCSGGTPFCCSPTGKGDATCTKAVTQCNTILICCANAAAGGSEVVACVGSATAAAPAPTTSTSVVTTGTAVSGSVTDIANASSSASRSRVVPLASSQASSRSFRGHVPSWSLASLLVLVMWYWQVLMISMLLVLLSTG